MKFYLFLGLILFEICICLYTHITTAESGSVPLPDESPKEPIGLLNDQRNSKPPDVMTKHANLVSNHIHASTEESPKEPIDLLNDQRTSKAPDVMTKHANLVSNHIHASTEESNTPSSDINDSLQTIPHYELKSYKERNLSDDISEDDDVVATQVEDADGNLAAAWVAALIFGAILAYVVFFIIAVVILECKGRGKRTTDDDKLGSRSVEKQKLLDGTSVSENTQDYYSGDEFENYNKSYTDTGFSLESSAVRTSNHSPLLNDRDDLHHILGSAETEVEVFPHGSLQRSSKKGCLQFQNDIIS